MPERRPADTDRDGVAFLVVTGGRTTVVSDRLRRFAERLRETPLATPLSRNALWALGGATIARALSLVTVVALARILGGVRYGELSALQATVVMFGSFASFGLSLTATRFVAEFRRTDPARAGRVIGLSTLVSIGVASLVSLTLVLLGPWLAKDALAAQHLGGAMAVAGLLVLLGAVNGAQTGALAGFEAFRVISRVNVVASLVSLAATVAGAAARGLNGALWGMALGLAVNAILNAQAVRAEAGRAGVPVTFAGCHQEWKLLAGFSLPTAIAEMMVGPVAWVCTALLVNQNGGYAELGVYSAVMRVKQLPEFLLGSLMSPLLPVLTARFGSGDEAGFGRTLVLAQAVSFVVMVPFAFLVALVPETALMPFGRTFLGHDTLVRWLMLQAVLVGLFKPMGSVLASMNRMWFGLGYNLLWAVTFVGLSVFLVPRWLGAGLAAAFALSHLLMSVPAYAVIRGMARFPASALRMGWLSLAALPLFVLSAATPSLVGVGMSRTLGAVALATSVGISVAIARRALGERAG